MEAPGATVVGAGICVERPFSPAATSSVRWACACESLACIKGMSVEGGVEFC